MTAVSSVPAHRTVFGWLSEVYDVPAAEQRVRSPVPRGGIIDLPLPVPAASLARGVKAATEAFGLHGFCSSDYVESDPDYANQSLTYNPGVPTPPERSTLGSPKLTRQQHYYGTKATVQSIGQVRGSYYDTYGFCVSTPAALRFLPDLLATFKRSPIRSRLSVIRGARAAPAQFAWGWHRDESVFENLRVNIPLTDCDDYALQISCTDEFPAQPGPNIQTYHTEVGRMYSWDTHTPHRACALRETTEDRTSIVLGFSPWFDYDAATDEWVPNEFFGKKHPLQMLLDGDVL